MRRNSSSSDRGKRVDTESYLRAYYPVLVKKAHHQGDINDGVQEYLLNLKPFDLDEMDVAYQELHRAIANKEWHSLMDRIAKGEEMLEKETDMEKRNYYMKLMKALTEELERMTPA